MSGLCLLYFRAGCGLRYIKFKKITPAVPEAVRGTVAPLGTAGAKKSAKITGRPQSSPYPGSNEQIAKKKAQKAFRSAQRGGLGEGERACKHWHAETMLQRGCGLRVRIAVK